MKKSVKGTLTEKNLLTSFAGESQAHMRYTFFAKAARKEGYEQIAAIFQETAEQECMHAKRSLKEALSATPHLIRRESSATHWKI